MLRLVKQFRDNDCFVATICASTTVLVAAVENDESGNGKAKRKARVTSHPTVKDEIVEAGWEYADDSERVVVDGKVITSRGSVIVVCF